MHFVPDPLHIEREMGRRLECQPPREKGDHVVSGYPKYGDHEP